MPCIVESNDEYNGRLRRELLDKLNAVTDMLCSQLRRLDETVPSLIVGECKDWWVEHKRKDAVRRKMATAAAERDTARRAAALAKLTPEERKLLNLG